MEASPVPAETIRPTPLDSQWRVIGASSPVPTATGVERSCSDDVHIIQEAADAYFLAEWQWPTAGGGAGDIVWDKLIPEYLDAIPAGDDACDWQVNSSPLGTVCLWDKRGKGSDCACGSVCTGQPGTGETLPQTDLPECERDRLAIQAAIDAYHTANGRWPTADGDPGPIVWDLIVPVLLEKMPATYGCNWGVNSDPPGEICQSLHPCGCCGCRGTLCN